MAGNRGRTVERVDVSEPASISSGVAARYATAIFELCKEKSRLGKLETGIEELAAALSESADLRAMIHSPVLSRRDQGRAISALAEEMGLVEPLARGLAVMAQNRRLYVVPHLIAHLRALIAEEKGEVTADVTSAKALTKAQTEKLAKTLAGRFGETVKINATVDDSLIGGLVVKVGSKMIDTSIRAQLNSLQNAMKEVG
jgi:F-type H+-transporting ATPase subunit delta